MTTVILKSMIAICTNMPLTREKAFCYSELIKCTIDEYNYDQQKICFTDWAKQVKNKESNNASTYKEENKQEHSQGKKGR